MGVHGSPGRVVSGLNTNMFWYQTFHFGAYQKRRHGLRHDSVDWKLVLMMASPLDEAINILIGEQICHHKLLEIRKDFKPIVF